MLEPVPAGKEVPAREASKPEVYTVEVVGRSYVVQVNDDIEGFKAVGGGTNRLLRWPQGYYSALSVDRNSQ
ncbi:hypothetical protein DBR00_16080 [Pseudomonas sp. HMWF032]|nr:hypothetical protein DBR00_16080 [Pseudomonas sp. HMWF032]PTT82901.1 hypothetical protein DBR41_12330 [Pseudomonas sp. HMWF010]